MYAFRPVVHRLPVKQTDPVFLNQKGLTDMSLTNAFDFESLPGAVFIRLGRHELFAEIKQDLHPSLPWFEHRSHRSGHNKTTELFFGRLAMSWDR